jgi:hypothetical protein
MMLQPNNNIKPIDNSWPTWAEIVKSQKIYSDKGIGDTLERIIKTTKLDKISKIYESITKKSCGCNDRKQHLNKKYSY